MTRVRGAVGSKLEAPALGVLGAASMLKSGSVDGINEILDMTLPQPVYTRVVGSSSDPTSPH